MACGKFPWNSTEIVALVECGAALTIKWRGKTAFEILEVNYAQNIRELDVKGKSYDVMAGVGYTTAKWTFQMLQTLFREKEFAEFQGRMPETRRRDDTKEVFRKQLLFDALKGASLV